MLSRESNSLGKAGRKFFQTVLEEFEITDGAGLALLHTAAECLDRISDAQKAIKRDGAVIRDRYGSPKVHPACQLERDARTGFLAAIRALNLDLEPLRDRPGRPGGSVQTVAQRRRSHAN